MEKADYLDVLEAESDAFLAAVASIPPNALVTSCGDWTIADLTVHQTEMWGFATANALGGGELTRAATKKPDDDSKLFDWSASVRSTMLEVLLDADPSAPAYTFAAKDQTAGFWQRRMVAETVVHRWDAQSANDNAQPIDPEVAADGIDEYTQVGLQYSSSRKNRIYPSSSLHLHCTDTEGEWMLTGDDGPSVTVTREHGKGDAAVRGDASTLLLWIWGRDAGNVEIFGNADIATTWRMLAP
ncbi:MAG: hypothetical protein ACI81L_002402 [Verrucomicrobiales bacterium]|jgi:uncharacterized protein (TIGR03083 family)